MPLWYEEAEFPVEVAPGDIEHLGEAGEPSIEKIAALNPDLIVGWDYQVEETYDQLSEIAPTVGVSPTNGPEWKESFRGVAEAVGREEEYKEYLQSYDERLRELRSELEGEPSDYTATVLWNFDDSAIWLYGEPSQPGSIVLDAGFRMPEIARIYDEISTERFPEVDADAIFVMAGEERIPRRREDFEPTFGDNALWRRLDAVENGRVYPVEIYLWTNGGPAGIRDVMLPQMFAAFEG
jgi:iron complex transport system substrate-binding protein